MRTPHDRRRPPTAHRRTLVALLSGALALASCGGADTAANEVAAAPVTTAPPAPVVQAISGNQVDFGDALTQDTVLWFWAPW